jgi:hypothetical protein
MSEVLTARERELQVRDSAPLGCGREQLSSSGALSQDKLRHTEQELRQANAELEERSKLLYKTKVVTW